MHKKVIKTMIKIQNEDLKDAEMLADYAEKMRHDGNIAFAQKLSMRAKMRASHYAEDEKEKKFVMLWIALKGMQKMPRKVFRLIYWI